MRKFFLIVGLLSFVLLGCSKNKTTEEKENGNSGATVTDSNTTKYKIGISQITTHPALDKAREGFKDAFKDAGLEIEFDEKDANGQISTANLIASNFVANNVNLIYAIGTPAVQAASKTTEDIPIVFSAVTDPVSAGLEKTNITGVSDLVDIKQQLELLLLINPNIKKIGVLYNSGEQNSLVQVEMLKKAAKELNVTIVEKGISQANEIQMATESLIKESDAIYLPTDNLVASVIQVVTDKTTEAKKITFGAESAHVEGGALITQGIDYYEMGKQAGKIAIDILTNGKIASEIKFNTMDLTDIVINEKTLNTLGITLPEDIKAKAKIIQ